MPEINRKFDQRTSEELLTLLLRSDDKAKAILKTVPIAQLDQAHRNELGITPKAFERLQASIEPGRRVEEAKAHYRKKIEKICSSASAIEFCREHFKRLIVDALQEEFHIVTLDTKNQVIDSHQITVGTLDASLVHPREGDIGILGSLLPLQ